MTGTITEPGVYDLPAHVYHSDPVPGGSLSSSGARKLLPPSCPALFRHYVDHGQPPNRAFDLGHAAHKLVLGAGESFAVITGTGKDPNAWRTDEDKAAVQAARDAGLAPITPAQHEQVQAMAAKLREHPIARALFDPALGKPEQTLIWRDDHTGIWRRAMLDWLQETRPGHRLIVGDYKTCASAAPGAISRSMDSYGYAQQADWYLDGVKAHGLAGKHEPAFVFVFQEKTAPYLVTVAQPDPDALLWGHRLNRKAINTYRQCVATGHWPGYADDVISVGLPAWSTKQLEDAWLAGDFDTTQENAA